MQQKTDYRNYWIIELSVWVLSIFLLTLSFQFLFLSKSHSLFTSVSVEAPSNVQVWKESVKNNIHPLDRDAANQFLWKTETSVKKLFLALPNNLATGDVEIKMNGEPILKSNLETIKSEWEKSSPPIDRIKLNHADFKDDFSQTSFYELPVRYSLSSVFTKIIPAINWGIEFSLMDLFVGSIFSLLIGLLLLFKKDLLLSYLNPKICFYFFPMIGLFSGFYMIHRFGVNIFWMDSLAFPEIFKAIDQGIFGWADLWSQHNEHRITFTRLTVYAMTAFKPVNLLTYTVLNQIVIFFTALFVSLKLKKDLKQNAALVFFIVSYFLFTPGHSENTILPFHGMWHSAVFGMLASVLMASENKDFMKSSMFWFSFLVAYFSMPSWVAIPIAICAGLFIENFIFNKKSISKRQLIHFTIFGFMNLAAFAFYMKDWVRVSVSPIDGIYKDPVRFILFFFEMIGNQIQQGKIAVLLGALLFFLSIFLVYLKRNKKIEFPTSMLYLLLISYSWCFITAVGRSTYGQAILPRYMFIGSAAWIAIFSVLAINSHHIPKFLKSSLILFFFGVFAIQNILGFSDANRIYNIIKNDEALVKRSLTEDNSIYLRYSNLGSSFGFEKKERRDYILELYQYSMKSGHWEFKK